MNQLWWGVAALVALMLFSLWRALTKSYQDESVDRLQLNRQAFREREAEIERQSAAGDLSAEEKARLLNENARQLLNEANEKAALKKSSDRLPVFAFMTVVLIGGCIGLYAWLGAHQQVGEWMSLQHRAQTDAEHKSSMQEMLLLLRTRLQHDPEDSEGWFMLGRSMLSLQQPQLAAQAFSRARALSPNDPDVLVAYAQSLRLGDANGSGADVDRLLMQARLLNPDHEGAVLMTAYRHFEKNEFAQAIPLFEKLKVGRAGDSEALQMIEASIQRAREGLAAKPVVPVTTPVATSPAPAAASSGESLTVSVGIADAVKKSASPDARVFIYARALHGPPMPLAVVTTTVAQLPLTVSLSDANAMNAAMKLSSQQDVQVVARISRTGNANATPGDWQGDLSIVNWRKNNKAQVTIQKQL